MRLRIHRRSDTNQPPVRTNILNDGRGFQRELEATFGAYQSKRTAHAKKIDPPTRVVGTGFNRRVIFLANPFPDFVGTWTKLGGRALFVEAKSTAVHRLGFNGTGGLTASQFGALKAWHWAGAACALLWKYNGRVMLFTIEDMLAREAEAVKSLVHENGRLIPQGDGMVLWDFLPALEENYIIPK